MNGFVATISWVPWVKLLYSALLVYVIALIGAHLASLWMDSQLRIGTFQFFESGQEKEAEGKTFALLLRAQHRALTHLLGESRKASQTQGDHTWLPVKIPPIVDPVSLPNDLQLSVQGINVVDVFARIRRWVSAPNEVSGVIEQTAGVVYGSVNWPSGPSRSDGDAIDGRVLRIDGARDSSEAAFLAACSIIWAQSAVQSAQLARTERRDFCDWAFAAQRFSSLQAIAKRFGDLKVAEWDEVKMVRAQVTSIIDRGSGFPDARRLRADIIDLLPGSEKKDSDLEMAQKDRIIYAVKTDPETAKLSEAEAALVVLARARPAFRVEGGRLDFDDDRVWKPVLTPYLAAIEAAAKATGVGTIHPVSNSAPPVFFSGFAVAEGIVVTIDQGLVLSEKDSKAGFPVTLGSEYEAYFSFDEGKSDNPVKDQMRITKVLYVNRSGGPPLALLQVEGHDVKRHPPLAIETAAEKIDEAVGNYVVAIGYPRNDDRMPPSFIRLLLGDQFRIKRAMPGRLILQKRETGVGPGGVRVLLSDTSTTKGTASAPIIDLRTGKVLAFSYAGYLETNTLGQSDVLKKLTYSAVLADFLPYLPAEVQAQIAAKK